MAAAANRAVMGKVQTVKNRAPAEKQITVEQLLHEAQDFRAIPFAPTKSFIHDEEELANYRSNKRKGFENRVQRNRTHFTDWYNYAKWEEEQKDFERARSVYERCLGVEMERPGTWSRYVHMEVRNRNLNHARNVLERAVAHLPRINDFWLKWIQLESDVGNVAGARSLFARWMAWKPEAKAWDMYIAFERKHKNFEGARQVFEAYLLCHNSVDTYLKFAAFEAAVGSPERARVVYERALHELGEDANQDARLYLAYAEFEQRQNERDNCRKIYDFALARVPEAHRKEVLDHFTQFERSFGSSAGVEALLTVKLRTLLEAQVAATPFNYDLWFEYARLEEDAAVAALEAAKSKLRATAPAAPPATSSSSSSSSTSSIDAAIDKEAIFARVREVYNRAVSQVPPEAAPGVPADKWFWRRYMYTWTNYAAFEELVAEDVPRARGVYKACLDVIPHEHFTFSCVWILAAELEVRARDLSAARRLLGESLGRCPRDKVFDRYVEIEMELGNMDRCRKLYEAYLVKAMHSCVVWVKCAQLEATLGETRRARHLFELAVSQPVLDMPEVLWKAYMEFETAAGEHDRVRQLYQRLLDRSKHVKIWTAWADFEAGISEFGRARKVYEEADAYLKRQIQTTANSAEPGQDVTMAVVEVREERYALVKSWLAFERAHGSEEEVKAAQAKQPEVVKKTRKVGGGAAAGGAALEVEGGAAFQSYTDYVFPDDREMSQVSLKLLEKARKWKEMREAAEAAKAAEAAARAAEAAAREAAEAAVIKAEVMTDSATKQEDE